MMSVDNAFNFPNSIRRVAVIGAGISGVASAAHLLREGLHVMVFERASEAGGVWHYDPNSAIEPPYPNTRPSEPFHDQSQLRDGRDSRSVSYRARNHAEAAVAHAPPGPCYSGLRNNIPTPVMRTKLEDWPEGTPDYTTHDQVEQYIKALAVRTGAQERIQYNTRVNLVEKYNCAGSDNSWKVHTSTLQKVGTGDGYEIVGHGWSFDAVVVCNGRYHEPRIPDLPGLREWKELYPAQVLHSKSYRSPMPFKGKNVFLLGSGVSALDIAREIVGLAKQLYRSSRNGSFDLPAGMFDPGVRTVGPVVKLVPDSQSGHGTVVLADGQAIHAIDVIILCTGYITSYPFLGDLQMPAVSKEKADERVIITSDGCTTHNLHKDIFYIPDPTLVFVGVPYHASAFSLFDFQAEVVARVLAGKAQLPSQKAMRAEYDRRRASIQAGGTAFHSLMKRDVEYMKSLQDWVNREAARLGCEPMDPINDQWVERYFHFVKEMEARRWSSQVVGQELKHAAPRAVLNHTKVNA